MAINGEFTWRQPPPRAAGPFRSPAAPWCSVTAHPPASPAVRALAEWPKRRLVAPIWCLKKCGCSGIYTYDNLWSRYPQIPQISLPQSSGNLDRVATLVPVFLEWPYAMHGFVSITSNTTQWNPTVYQHSTYSTDSWDVEDCLEGQCHWFHLSHVAKILNSSVDCLLKPNPQQSDCRYTTWRSRCTLGNDQRRTLWLALSENGVSKYPLVI